MNSQSGTFTLEGFHSSFHLLFVTRLGLSWPFCTQRLEFDVLEQVLWHIIWFTCYVITIVVSFFLFSHASIDRRVVGWAFKWLFLCLGIHWVNIVSLPNPHITWVCLLDYGMVWVEWHLSWRKGLFIRLNKVESIDTIDDHIFETKVSRAHSWVMWSWWLIDRPVVKWRVLYRVS